MADKPADDANQDGDQDLDGEQLQELLTQLADREDSDSDQQAQPDGAAQAEGWILPRPADMAHLSPTLVSLEAKRQPSPEPVCVACPKSMWLSQSASLKCFCRVMHAVTWDSDDPQPILTCDGAMMPDE